MTSLNLIVSFASAARHSSFANAARELNMTPSAVAKNIASLETQLGVKLFYRTTRRVTLSPDGEDLYARCQRILEEVEALEALAAEARSSVSGTLRIDMPITYGRLVVLPMLAKLVACHPKLKIDARFSDQVSDLVKEGLDAVVRIGLLDDSNLVGRKFDDQTIWTCASPQYLAERSEPKSPDDLPQHNCLSFRFPSSGRDRLWQFRVGKGQISLAPDSRVRVGDGEALVQAAVAGMGIVQAPSYIAKNEVKRGNLVEILQEYRPEPLPIYLLYPSHHHTPPRLRALLDELIRKESHQFT
jgi:LysR family transcriptional regulator for bpeEF and oprC